MATKVGNLAIFFGVVADGLAAVPTITKSYSHPETENESIYWFGVINSIIGLLTITVWRFEYWGFPLYLLFVNLIIAGLIRFKLGKKL